MKRKTLGTLLLLAVIAPTAMAADPSSTLSGHRLRDTAGNETTLAALRGRVVVVNFWASWCTPCKRELPIFDAWNRELPDDQVVFAAISIDQEPRNVERFVERTGLELPVYHDGVNGLAKSLNLPYLPCTYVLDGNGRVALVTSGATDAKLSELRRVIDGLRSTSTQASISGGQP